MQQEKINGLIKACKYSYITNKKNYCGAINSFKAFESFINVKNNNIDNIEKIFPSFQGLYAYLNLIGKVNSLQPLNEKVIEAYWLGSSLIENISIQKVKEMILTDLTKPGLMPKRIAEKKANNIPKGVVPNHSFHVLYMNFITKKVQPIIQNLDNCLISWGKIKEMDENSLLVKASTLIFENNEFKLLEKDKKIDKGFIENLKKNSIVSIHWNFGIEKLSENEFSNLKKYSKKNIEAINSSFSIL